MIQEKIVNQVTIPTERMHLRPLRRSDEGLLSLYFGDIRVASQTRAIPHPLPPGASAAFIDRSLQSDRKEDVWAMDGTEAGLAELLGIVTLQRLSPERSEIGYWVAPAFWNAGYASEAVVGLLEANPQNVRTVFAEVFQSNPVSARVLSNAGFDYIGDAEAFSVAQNTMVSTWTYLRRLTA
ncbi:GNAT family N-acetyltransferase [Pseudoruegeria sp. SK021]|uniref:GNAT family N-acetyltransferase n=1 Tax=Pseudoruegeria sp. SK021 TaxID=1933035 RepID=UPI000A23067E|nr:GNAT family N-acetyltransferase [Pseudoruegeria sp. SK021]OSP56372.1 GNAT family N-acetyltransferase [Pseudoruegeria sp. SK021]